MIVVALVSFKASITLKSTQQAHKKRSQTGELAYAIGFRILKDLTAILLLRMGPWVLLNSLNLPKYVFRVES